MRLVPVILAGTVLAALPALAQVTVNPGALDALPKPAHPARPRPAPHRPARPAASAPTPPAPAAPAKTAKPEKPVIPVTPPAILAIPPPVVVPLSHPPPPPPVPVADDAPGDATPLAGGVRITFGADRFQFNPTTEAALRSFARSLAGKEDARVNIYAYAAGAPDDPSTPRRLSLERALAARAVLMDEGIASPRIYPRALGPAGGGGDPDRIDVTSGQPGPPPAPPQSPAG